LQYDSDYIKNTVTVEEEPRKMVGVLFPDSRGHLENRGR
jgi:hypothetical protein